MKIEILKSKLNLIKSRLQEFKNRSEVNCPKPEFERLFSEFNEVVKILKVQNPEVFGEIKGEIQIMSETVEGLYGHYTRYKWTCLENLLFEVDKTLNYIEVEQNETTADKLSNPIVDLNRISSKFHFVTRQLRKRYNNRETLDVADEYDVQDLYHSLLRLYFSDIRVETYMPEYGGRNSRIDFLLKQHNLGIEIKHSRKSLKAKELGEQLIIDIERYGSYSGISDLYCFIYDPDGWVENPVGLENDLSGIKNSINVIVKIEPT